jgi:serine protease Do
MKTRLTSLSFAAIVLATGLALALPAGVATAQTGPVVATPTDFSGIFERYGATVVNITVVGRVQRNLSNDPFYNLYRHFGLLPQQEQQFQSSGSGFVISNDGLILTNTHVIRQGTDITVKMSDRREFKAKVLGADAQTDVAVLKIEGKSLPVVKIGNPATTRVGEPVLAIGSPYGLENTASGGIVSAKSRTLQSDSVVPFIQTDVSINPGNSGGPLFNLRGEVIGINSQIFSVSGGSQGLSFAIPIDVALHISDQIVKTGKVSRGWLGLATQEVTQALADSLNLKKPQGALVNGIERGGAAERAGLRVGDVVTRLGETEIRQSGELHALIANLKPGSNVTLEVVRDGKSKSLTAQVSKVEERSLVSSTSTNGSRFEVSVRPLTRNELRQLGVNAGLLVQQAQGSAAQAGIEDGDVILAVNNQAVGTVEQLQKLVSRASRKITVLIQRESERFYLPIALN